MLGRPERFVRVDRFSNTSSLTISPYPLLPRSHLPPLLDHLTAYNPPSRLAPLTVPSLRALCRAGSWLTGHQASAIRHLSVTDGLHRFSTIWTALHFWIWTFHCGRTPTARASSCWRYCSVWESTCVECRWEILSAGWSTSLITMPFFLGPFNGLKKNKYYFAKSRQHWHSFRKKAWMIN